MQHKPPMNALIAVTVLSSVPIMSMGGSWQTELQDGSHVWVDPNTNRGVIVTPNGARTQLWNGVHRLRNGGEITVRSGVVVPNKEILDIERERPQPQAGQEAKVSACAKLVLKVCGPNGECSDQPACSQAHQLVQFEKEEREDNIAGFEQAPQQCAEALGNMDFFKPCVEEATPCQELVEKVCGAGAECAGQPACDAAGQLLEMETQERLSGEDASVAPYSMGQCKQALHDDGYFAACAPFEKQGLDSRGPAAPGASRVGPWRWGDGRRLRQTPP